MRSKSIQRVQDSIHGLMEFHGMQTSVVDILRAPELQRLRRIRHLGLAHLVFPAAEHSRLVHSLGSAHVAIRFARRLTESSRNFVPEPLLLDSSEIRDFALAALFHDLGHGPLSHVWEREAVGDDFDRAAWCNKLGLEDNKQHSELKWHELVTQAILAWKDGHLHKLLESQERNMSKRIRRLLSKEHYCMYLPRLLSADIDVDRCDYILRDARQTGVAYGRYDLDWLLSTATLGDTLYGAEEKRLVVGFDIRKAPRVVEQFLIARRALYETVYYHKTVRSAEKMIGLLLRRLKKFVRDESNWPLDDTPLLLEPIKKIIEDQPLSPQEILSLDDYSLWLLIHELSKVSKKDKTLADLATRIIERDLYKLIPCTQDQLEKYFNPETQQHYREKLQKAVADFCPGDPDYYLIYDQIDFTMLNEADEEVSYFVDLDTKERRATPIKEHPTLMIHLQTGNFTLSRLFAPREIVVAVQDFLAKN